jgi:hypothetical protein
MIEWKNPPPEALTVFDHLRPTIRISPFSGSNMQVCGARAGYDDARAAEALDPAVWQDGGRALTFFRSGREAITAVLAALGMRQTDVVSIITTTGGPYVSSCVTNAIHKVCRSSREIGRHTAAVLLIHEFGFPAELPEAVRALHVPVIEDCAYAFGTRLRSRRVGSIGDFVIYSLPKFLAVPFGGMLISSGSRYESIAASSLSKSGADFLSAYLRQTYQFWDKCSQLRRDNWAHFERECPSVGFRPYFDLADDVVPGVFLMRLPVSFDGAALKIRGQKAGIECTEYYGQQGFFFPVHQCLSDYDKRYILTKLMTSGSAADLGLAE